MADKNSGWACTHGASIISESNTSVTIRVICYWQNQSWRYNINNVSAWVYCGSQSSQVLNAGAVNTTGIANNEALQLGYADFVISKTTATQNISCYGKITSSSSYVSGTKSSSASSVSVAAKPSYAIKYNANGGSGAPGSQTKWYGTNLTLSSAKPTRTGYTFQGWGTSASDTSVDYAAGATYTANAGITLYAIWKANTYTVSYNANGGSGAPGSQTKTYGVNLTLSSTIPTRTNYNFLGWSTSASGSVVYAAGATYTNNSAVTLYAVWELAYTKPRITNFTAHRCTSDGVASETGTYVKITFDWATDKDVTTIRADWNTDPNFSTYYSANITASGTSGSVSQIVGEGTFSTEITYFIRVTVKDGTDYSRSPVLTIGTVKFPIDVKNGGTGVAFGKVAEKDAAEFDYDVYLGQKLYYVGLDGAYHEYRFSKFICDLSTNSQITIQASEVEQIYKIATKTIHKGLHDVITINDDGTVTVNEDLGLVRGSFRTQVYSTGSAAYITIRIYVNSSQAMNGRFKPAVSFETFCSNDSYFYLYKDDVISFKIVSNSVTAVLSSMKLTFERV